MKMSGTKPTEQSPFTQAGLEYVGQKLSQLPQLGGAGYSRVSCSSGGRTPPGEFAFAGSSFESECVLDCDMTYDPEVESMVI